MPGSELEKLQVLLEYYVLLLHCGYYRHIRCPIVCLSSTLTEGYCTSTAFIAIDNVSESVFGTYNRWMGQEYMRSLQQMVLKHMSDLQQMVLDQQQMVLDQQQMVHEQMRGKAKSPSPPPPPPPSSPPPPDSYASAAACIAECM